MSEQNGNEPASPVAQVTSPNGDIESHAHYGLTKRELFAAMAMQGLCANQHAWEVPIEKVAEFSVQQADALLAELATDRTEDGK